MRRPRSTRSTSRRPPRDRSPASPSETAAAHRATATRAGDRDLDAYRVGWELIDHPRYSYWGGKRAVVMQFSRGCPHLCNYCGQRGFWTRWRHRDPEKFAARDRPAAPRARRRAASISPTRTRRRRRKAWRGVSRSDDRRERARYMIWSARPGPTISSAMPISCISTARPGSSALLLGMENTDEATLALIRKGGGDSDRPRGDPATAPARHPVDGDLGRRLRGGRLTAISWRGFRQLLSYDPDQIQALYVTPHRWTPLLPHRRGPAGDPDRSAASGTTSTRFWRRRITSGHGSSPG